MSQQTHTQVAGRDIPMVDLPLQHERVAEVVEAGFRRVLERGAFVLGEEGSRFEEAYAAYCTSRHCIGVASGTDALEIAARAIGIEPGDEVILPTNSFIASASAVVRAGATPRLVDVDDETLLVDPDAVADAIGPRTTALMPVHLFGQMAPMPPLTRIAESAGLALIEDAAQSQGAKQDGAHLPSARAVPQIAATSFYPGKNLGAYGDAGAVLTDDDGAARRSRALRNHGRTTHNLHPELGFTSRLDEIQAVVLAAKLALLDDWNAERRAAAKRYDDLLVDVDEVRRPAVASGNSHVWHLYAVRIPDRDHVLDHLRGAAIGAGIHYPVPIHLQVSFEAQYRPGQMPVAERAARELLSLPIYPGITVSQQERVVDELRLALRRS